VVTGKHQLLTLDGVEQFALAEASYTVVRLLQRFDGIENMEPPGPIKFHHALTNSSGTGVQVRLHEAKYEEADAKILE
jgi:hypothetical protein